MTDKVLLHRFGWQDKRIAVCEQSIKWAEEEVWLEEQIDRLMEIRDQFEFIAVNGDAGDDYETEDFKGNFV